MIGIIGYYNFLENKFRRWNSVCKTEQILKCNYFTIEHTKNRYFFVFDERKKTEAYIVKFARVQIFMQPTGKGYLFYYRSTLSDSVYGYYTKMEFKET
jgi:hypothetical protein